MQTSPIPFSYATLYEWYRRDKGGITEPTDDIIVRIYTADYRAMKYRRGQASPFKTPNMTAVKVHDLDPLVTSHAKNTFAHGLFLVYDTADDARVMRNKALYVVFPRKHTVLVGDTDVQTMVSADHFSLCIDHNDKTKPLHFHRTIYVPDYADPNRGDHKHTNNYLPATFDLPRSLTEFMDPARGLVTDEFRNALAAPMKDVLSRPWLASSAVSTTGGGRRRRRPRARVVTGFDDLWTVLPIRKIVVIGVKVREGTFAFTVFIHDRLRHEVGTLRKAVRFDLEEADAHDESQVQREIVRLIGGLVWHDFEDLDDM